jgi:integrase
MAHGRAHEDGSSYLPISALPYWERLGPFVNEVVDRCARDLDRDRESLYAAVTPFVVWSWQARGRELTVIAMFTARAVEQFVHQRLATYAQGSRATLRSTLWRILELLAPAEAASPRRAIPRSQPTEPYTAAEVAVLYSWADGQRTVHRQLDALALLGLAFGAGLATRELLRVKAEHCLLDPGGIRVRVDGSRAREVPVAEEWVSTLRRVIEARDGRLLFRPDRLSAAEGQVTDFILRSRTRLEVRPARMRTTWLLSCLIAGVDPATLRRISGLSSLAAVDRIADFVPSSGVTSGPFSSRFDPNRPLAWDFTA